MTMKENYRAWEIDYDEFFRQTSDRDRLKFLVRFAVLAPSSHNSQPWRFEVTENEILVKPDMQRALPKSDTN
ncbi:MAG: nitroreductase family protein, partial [Patescibacteria group bacterium]